MVERLLILIVALLIVLLVGSGWRWMQKRRMAQLAVDNVPAEVAQLVAEGKPALLYFTTESCVQCRFQQSPILSELATQTPLPVYTVDAVKQERLADYYGIMTVPATVVLDSRRRPVAINHGLASLARLQAQTANLGLG
jgi:thiol-disulfide isomerase/thioredoxin